MAITYKEAGVDIEAGNEAVRRIKQAVGQTFNPAVLNGIGGFAALYDLKPLFAAYDHPVMVQSIDGVGTKMILARMMNDYRTIGADLVSATVNDIIVMGAKPLTLLDYIAADKIAPATIEAIVQGMAASCAEHGIALVGGETAEMPDTYLRGEHDLVGIVTGVVERNNIIDGCEITAGDVILALPSSGLHTNGYSLARKLCFEVAGWSADQYCDALQASIGETLLTPHRNYCQPILSLLAQGVTIKGMAHITGGGLLENLPRVLPDGCTAEISISRCPSLPVFSLLRDLGDLSQTECYTTFNMGIGLVMVLSSADAARVQALLPSLVDYPVYSIGTILPGNRQVRLVA